MDETSPVYENFLNQMRRFRRPVRETTRRISASKFLDKPENKTIEEIKNLKVLLKACLEILLI